jgi:autotransporter-associated beta strand protein
LFTNTLVVTGNASFNDTSGDASPGYANVLSGSGTFTNNSATTTSFDMDVSGFTGTWVDNSSITLFTGTTANSMNGAQANWVINTSLAVELYGSGNLTMQMGSLSGNGSFWGHYGSSATSTYVVGALNQNSTFGGAFTSSGGSTALVKVGSGTLTLGGANTYTGNTTVSNGTLLVNGSIGASAVTVATNATLGGVGTIGGSVTLNTGASALFTNGATLKITGALIASGNTVYLNLSNNVPVGTYTLATNNPTGSSGSFASTPVINSGSFAANMSYIITNGAGKVNLVVTTNTTSPPATPTNLTATAGNALVSLSWNASSGATNYNVWRSTSSGSGYGIIAGVATTNYTDTVVTNGTTYYYEVAAVNGGGASTNSAPVAAQPLSSVPPQIGLTSGSGSLQLSWPVDHLGWLLQSQTNPPAVGLGTNWVTLPGSGGTNQATILIGPTNGCVFFRLSHP